MRTKQEVRNEISALKALKPSGEFRLITGFQIRLAIRELETGLAEDELNFLTAADLEVAERTRQWMHGKTRERPSEGWGSRAH